MSANANINDANVQALQSNNAQWSQEYAMRKIDIVSKKLNGIHPCVIAMEELGHGQGKNYQLTSQIEEVLMGEKGTIRRRVLKSTENKNSFLDVDQVCDCLLEWSLD